MNKKGKGKICKGKKGRYKNRKKKGGINLEKK